MRVKLYLQRNNNNNNNKEGDIYIYIYIDRKIHTQIDGTSLSIQNHKFSWHDARIQKGYQENILAMVSSMLVVAFIKQHTVPIKVLVSYKKFTDSNTYFNKFWMYKHFLLTHQQPQPHTPIYTQIRCINSDNSKIFLLGEEHFPQSNHESILQCHAHLEEGQESMEKMR